MSKEVIIAGAGPGGLAAALLLAKAGVKVSIFEKMDRVGGRTSAWEHEGFRFDMGPTFFLYPQVLKSIYAAIGHNLFKEVPMVRLIPQYHLVFGSGGDILAKPDVQSMEQEIAKISPADAKNFIKFLDDNREKLKRFKPCLESPFRNWKDIVKVQMLKLLPLLRPWASLDNELNRYFSDPRIRLAFSFQSKYLGMSPFKCPSLFSILSFLEYEHGVFHPMGGCSAVSEHMAKIAIDMGVNIHLNSPIDGIEFQGKKAVGIHSKGQLHNCDSLVINADFANAMQKLVPDNLRPKWSDKKLSKKKYSCSTFMMYLGVEGLYENLQHHTIYMSKDYQGNLQDIEKNHVLSDDPSFYVQNACVTDPSLAPKGMSTLYVLLPVTHMHENVNWTKEKSLYRAKALNQLKKLGLNDVEKRIRVEKIFTPHDWQHQMEIYRGATFNLAHNLGQMLNLRPRNRFEDLESVYLVGGGTHPGSGLPVIYESARITSRLLLQDFSLNWEHCVPPEHYEDHGSLNSLSAQDNGLWKSHTFSAPNPLAPLGR